MVTIQEIDSSIRERNQVFLFRISNSTGAYVEVTNYGASVISVVVPDKNGVHENVVLRYNDFNSYFTDPFYLGATVGRVANRISNARFTLNGQTYLLDKNDGKNSNHGGNQGFNKKVFDYAISSEGVLFRLHSKDGEGGFPGNLDFSVFYSFSNNNELEITYTTQSDLPTPVNFTNHSYFNLSGGMNNDILHDLLWINAEHYLEANNEFLPTGKINPVQGGAFDFSTYKRISERMHLKQDNLQGYNAYYLKNQNGNPLASLKNEVSGRIVDLYTTMPGVLVYTGEFLSGEFKPFGGICLEAQYPPDAINQPHFISNILQQGQAKTDRLTYHFRVEG